MNGRQKGKQGERLVRKELSRCAFKKRRKLLNGIYLPLYDGCCEVDHILCGSFGVCVIETKNIGGEINGSAGDTYLTHTMGTKVHRLYNPLLQNKTHRDNVIHHLKKAGMGGIPVYSFVVYTDSNIIIRNPALGITLGELSGKLDSLKDAGCSPKELNALFKKIRVKNPFKKLLHRLSCKRKNKKYSA